MKRKETGALLVVDDVYRKNNEPYFSVLSGSGKRYEVPKGFFDDVILRLFEVEEK